MKHNPYGDMDQPAYRTAYLIAGYIRNTLTEKEHDELDDWINESDQNMQIFEELTDEKYLEASLAWMDRVRKTEKKAEGFVINDKGGANQRNRWFKAAASVILLVGLGFFIYYITTNDRNNSIDTVTNSSLLPSTVTLNLENGEVIDLAKAKGREIFPGVLVLPDGQGIHYNREGSNQTDMHTLKTPYGKQFKIELSDGTKIWLNAKSQIEYPSSFLGTERELKLSGEGYFEVAEDTNASFRVVMNDSTSVIVTGTKFNIFSYKDHRPGQITLLEGAVKVKKGREEIALEPGNCVFMEPGGIRRSTVSDIASVTGWKDGNFIFKNATLQTVMDQLQLWYNVKVIYNTDLKQHFNAEISRNESLEKVLHLLSLSSGINFYYRNDTIYVQP